MKQRRLKIIAASAILLTAMVVLVVAGIKKTSVQYFTPADLVANADTIHRKKVQVDGVVLEGSSHWDAANFKLTFAVRNRDIEEAGKTTVNVIFADRLKPDNFMDGGSVFVEGRYDADRNLVIATKVMTKCASKYEGADNTVTESDTSYLK